METLNTRAMRIIFSLPILSVLPLMKRLRVLFAIPATKWTAEGIYVLLRLSRVYWWWWLGSGWPELTAASSAAAAGVRVRSGSVLQGVWGGVGAFYVLLVMCGARWCARLGATATVATTATSPAAWSARSRWS